MNDESLTDEKRAELYHKLAESAWQRFATRRELEWRVAAGICGLFVTGALAIALSTVSLPLPSLLLLAAIALAVLGVYVGWWLPFISESSHRDAWTSYYYESFVQNLLSSPLPEFLRPPHLDSQPWYRAPEQGQTDFVQPTAEQAKNMFSKWHRSRKTQVAITGAFAALFLVAAATKSFSTSSMPRITVEGQFEADSTSKLKLSR